MKIYSALCSLFLFFIATAAASIHAHPKQQDHQHHHHHLKGVEKLDPKLDPHHDCIHDSVIVPHLKKNPPSVNPQIKYASSAAGRINAQSQSIGNIRISLRTDDLTTAGRFCASASGSVPDYLGSTIACSAATVFNSTKYDTLVNKILPAALAVLQGALQVDQATSAITATSTSVCGSNSFTVTSADVSTGTNNTDLILFVSAAPIASSSTIAWAGSCQVDSAGRPVIGKINFSPAHLIGFFDNDETFRKTTVNTAVHETLHAMGFSSSMFSARSLVTTTTRRGKTVSQINGTNAVAAARTQFGCSTLTGVELEDQGGSGTAGSHWERRVYYQEMMTGISGRDNVLTAMTLGYLQDLGFYYPVSSSAQALRWGNAYGCGFSEDKCGLTTGGMGTYFCQTNGLKTCSFDNRSFGLCTMTTYSADISPTYFQYFSDPKSGGGSSDLMDFCPFVVGYSNYQCDDISRVASSLEGELGFSFGSSSRCFIAPDLKQTTSSVVLPGWDGRCMKMICNSGFIQITLPDSSVATCPASGLAGTATTPSGWSGTITCPTFASLCTGVATVASTTSTIGPSTTSTTTTATTTSTTTTTTTTSAPVTTAVPTLVPTYTLRISGGISLRTLYNDRSAQLLQAIRTDVASVLGLSSADITVTRIQLDNSSVDVTQTAVFVYFTAIPNNMYGILADSTLLASAGVTAPSWLVQTQTLHLSVGSTSATISAVSTTNSAASLTMNTDCDHGCRLFIAACVIFGIVLVVCIGYVGYQFWVMTNGPSSGDYAGENQPQKDAEKGNVKDQELENNSNNNNNQQQEFDNEGRPIRNNNNNANNNNQSPRPAQQNNNEPFAQQQQSNPSNSSGIQNQ